jgi:mono/diheme cytochrome c family protein
MSMRRALQIIPGLRATCSIAVPASLLAILTAGPAAGQEPTAVPSEVTDSAIAAGRALYDGSGGCRDCHGEGGAGTAEGPALVTGRWKLGDGGYAWLVHMTRHAGWGARTRYGDPQPMRGPTVLDSAEVRQVAAYVWSISRDKLPAPPPAR